VSETSVNTSPSSGSSPRDFKIHEIESRNRDSSVVPEVLCFCPVIRAVLVPSCSGMYRGGLFVIA
jgi:hypothetical protein